MERRSEFYTEEENYELEQKKDILFRCIEALRGKWKIYFSIKYFFCLLQSWADR